jgi:hypothetical protein
MINAVQVWNPDDCLLRREADKLEVNAPRTCQAIGVIRASFLRVGPPNGLRSFERAMVNSAESHSFQR